VTACCKANNRRHPFICLQRSKEFIMKTAFAALIFVFAATGALAESPNAGNPPAQRTVSTLTRADVVGEVLQARAAGTLIAAGEIGQPPVPTVLSKTRDEVRAELLNTDRRYANGYQPA
jgi:hypothetical protein